MQEKQVVVLIHGLGGTRLDMWPIARRLKSLGFSVENWGYRSLGNRIETHVERISQRLRELDQGIENGDASSFHIVGHSMGGIITRAVLAKEGFSNLGRVVLLAAPNKGSHVARKLVPWIGWMSPSLEQLSDRPDSYVNQLPNSLCERNIEFGIVEASKDRVIEPGKVELEGRADFASVAGNHGLLTWYPETLRIVSNFLTEGAFEPQPVRSLAS